MPAILSPSLCYHRRACSLSSRLFYHYVLYRLTSALPQCLSCRQIIAALALHCGTSSYAASIFYCRAAHYRRALPWRLHYHRYTCPNAALCPSAALVPPPLRSATPTLSLPHPTIKCALTISSQSLYCHRCAVPADTALSMPTSVGKTWR